ncbi:hypothetical protein [Streptomyces adustus]
MAEQAAVHASLDDHLVVFALLDSLRKAEAQEHLRTLAERAAVHVSLGNPHVVADLLDWLRKAGGRSR